MIERLQITHLRNISRADLRFASCNVFIGANGSGKTSLLEGLFLLSRGKSFRHHQPKRYIQHHQPSVTIHATFYDGVTVAIQKQLDATTALRLNQDTIYTQSTLTQQLPTLLIDPSSMDMLEQGSASRRQLLDWLAFHVKPGFHAQWLAYQRLLKQRNRLLKQSRQLTLNQRQELSAWDVGLAHHAALIHHYRQQVFDAWQPYFERCVAALLPKYSGKLSLSYLPGYDSELGLQEQLEARLTQDLQQGFTRMGSHRADIQVHWRSHGLPATSSDDRESELSESQSKAYKAVSDGMDSGYTGVKSEVETDIEIDVDENIDESIDEDRERLMMDGITETKDQPIKEQAANVLSRGEKKLLITALKLSQLPLLLTETAFEPPASATTSTYSETISAATTTVSAASTSDTFSNTAHIDSSPSDSHYKTISQSHAPAVLLDDITAELDSRAIEVLLSTLSSLHCQVFITSLTEDIVPELKKYWSDFNLFHVKHGEIDSVIP